MKSSFACSILVSVAALVGAGCGPSCHPETFCRWFDLATFCNENGGCSVPPGMGLTSVQHDGDRVPLDFVSPGTFNDLGSRTFITVPMGQLSGVLLHEPVLEIWLNLGAPLTVEQIEISLDGQAVLCDQVKRTDPVSGLALACLVPVGTRELRFEYANEPHAAAPGSMPFNVGMFLREQDGSCTGTQQVCAL